MVALCSNDNACVAGNSWCSGLFVGHLSRFGPDGTQLFSKKLAFSCATSDANFVHPTRLFRLASGAIGLLGSFDANGGPQWERGAQLSDAAGLWQVRPGGLRLTNDGGALVLAHVTDPALDKRGLWISKLPARTGEAPFDPALVSLSAALPQTEDCTSTLLDDGFVPLDLAMRMSG